MMPLIDGKDRSTGLRRKFAVAVCAGLCVFGALAAGQVSETGEVDPEAQVLIHGPVHEAFAGVVAYNPEPGVVVGKAPPVAIDEIPPEERPSGDNISWIPGYWGWDDERDRHLWVSGIWRALPPGRRWTTGYWGASEHGYQWTRGYWSDSAIQETTYLPKPPSTLEAGPNVEPPSQDHGWIPGSWLWGQHRYVWRPGYWAEGRSNWDWIPAQYLWTASGYIFVDGYWDYSFVRRGVLYAPVDIQETYYLRPGYSYSPVIAIGLVAMMEHLFLRPDYHHYYFGDYYDRKYRGRGYFTPYEYHSSRHGYDPVYANRKWTHRRDGDWENQYRARYNYRRDHESARPKRTWDNHRNSGLHMGRAARDPQIMASVLADVANSSDTTFRVEKISVRDRQELTLTRREVLRVGDQRRLHETTKAKGKDRDFKPSQVRLPVTRIVGRSRDGFDKAQAPPEPQHPPVIPTKGRKQREESPGENGDQKREQQFKQRVDPRNFESQDKAHGPSHSRRGIDKPKPDSSRSTRRNEAEVERDD